MLIWEMNACMAFIIMTVGSFLQGWPLRSVPLPVISAEVPSGQSFDFHLQLSSETRPARRAESPNSHVTLYEMIVAGIVQFKNFVHAKS